MAEVSNGSVEFSIADGVATIEFGHPKGNSLPSAILRDLANRITAMGADPAVRVVVIRSKGAGPFCAGASFDELRTITTFEVAREFFMGFARVILALRSIPKCTIARVHGKIVGGGVGVVSACDYSVATPAAESRLSELALGIGPFVIGPCVSRRVGASRFSTMAVAGGWHSAQWGHEAGLYSALVDSVNALDAEVDRLARQLAHGSLDAARELKRVLWEDTVDWETLLPERAQDTARLLLSEFCQKSLAAIR